MTGILLNLLDLNTTPLLQALACLLEAAQEARVVFELIVKPIVLQREADQHAGRLPIAGDYDLLVLDFAQKPGEILLDFR